MLGFWTSDNITSKRSNKRRKHITTTTRAMITSSTDYNCVSGNRTDDDVPTYQTVQVVRPVPDLPGYTADDQLAGLAVTLTTSDRPVHNIPEPVVTVNTTHPVRLRTQLASLISQPNGHFAETSSDMTRFDSGQPRYGAIVHLSPEPIYIQPSNYEHAILKISPGQLSAEPKLVLKHGHLRGAGAGGNGQHLGSQQPLSSL